MYLIRGMHNLRSEHRGCVVTIGNFDGVHRGHCAVLQGLKKRSAQFQAASCVITFEPPPVAYFNPGTAPMRLMGLHDKHCILREIGIDLHLVLPFTTRLATYPAEAFIRNILVNRLGTRHIVVGDDFHFGYRRRGDFALLQAHGKHFHFSVEPTSTYRQDTLRISSTRIRQALARHDLQLATEFLGRPFFISGRVLHGDKRGRTIGYPTANVKLPDAHGPLKGVFAVEAITAAGTRHTGMASIGTRPTVDQRGETSLEVHLFDFADNIYHQRLRVVFHHYLREERRFPSLTAMIAALDRDAAAARHFFGR